MQNPLAATVAATATGTQKQLLVDAAGNLSTAPAAGTAHNFAAVSAGVAVKTGPGVLQSLTVNTAATGAGTVTLYDGTSTAGTKLATVSTLALASLSFNIAFTLGLFAVIASTTTPADVTIVTR